MKASVTEPAGPVSPEEFRRWYEAQTSGRFERVDGRIVAMAPQRGAHLRMKAAVWLTLRQARQAAGLACQALPDGATVEVGDNTFEPDAIVNCGDPMTDEAIAVPNPVVVVEVLSPATASVDTARKLIGYFEAPSIVHYLIVNPLKRLVIHHRRRDGGTPIETNIVMTGDLVLDPPGITINIEAMYDAAI